MTRPAQGSPATRVAFIGATGRSGSTLLAKVLGTAPGVCSVGELTWLWSYGVARNRPCGCGEPFHACPFWTEVGASAFGGWDRLDAGRATALRRSLTSNARLPALWTGRAGARLASDLSEYRALLAALYAAIARVSGAQVVVDNSKQVTAAMVARGAPGVDVRLVHLVRRSHGVANSWHKHVVRDDMGGREMRRRSPVRTALRWSVDNAMFEAVGATGTPRALVRYEELVADPLASTRRLLTFLDVPPPPGALAYIRGDEVDLLPDHSVWGNPMRMRRGPERLRPDDAWRESLSIRQRRGVTGASLPVLWRYGYLGSGPPD